MIMTDRSPADYRALCTELVDAIASGIATKRMYRSALVIRARAALAEPQPPAGEVAELPPRPSPTERPAHSALERYGVTWNGSPLKPLLTRMADGYWTPWHVAADLLELLAATGKPGLQVEPTDEELLGVDDLRDAWNAQADSANSWDELGIDEIVWWAQRQALARWGRPASQPTPVNERLPEAGDCKDEGWAWFFNPRVGWRQAVIPVSAGYTHWLPATALPLPSGEVK
jgi:hypothetical protein